MIAKTYNGYKNWETWITAMNYDNVLYDLAKAYIKNGLTYEAYCAEVEDLIRRDTYSGVKFPSEYTLVGEFVMAALRDVDFDHLANSGWENAQNDM